MYDVTGESLSAPGDQDRSTERLVCSATCRLRGKLGGSIYIMLILVLLLFKINRDECYIYAEWTYKNERHTMLF